MMRAWYVLSRNTAGMLKRSGKRRGRRPLKIEKAGGVKYHLYTLYSTHSYDTLKTHLRSMVPLIDIAPLVTDSPGKESVARQIGTACRTHGFFYITGHGVPEDLQNQLESVSKTFFAMDESEKMKIRMALAGKAWRGFFPIGDELTSGKPDIKEGLYFGQELDNSDPGVKQGLPMHGSNLFPAALPEMHAIVLNYMKALTQVGHTLMEGIALSLGLDDSYFYTKYTGKPLTLFRIFHYPTTAHSDETAWGVGEHTDYGVLTILKQDQTGGLQVKSQSKWIDAPPIPGTFVCNIGDMLDRMTRGLYRSTPHRVKNVSNKSRYSFPFFFDPAFDAHIQPINTPEITSHQPDAHDRWDHADLAVFDGTYGEYILGKVANVFPALKDDVL